MKVVDERTILSFLKRGERVLFLPDARLTPAAQDLVHRHRLQIVRQTAPYTRAVHPPKRIVLGSDHGGFDLKNSLVERLRNAGYTVMDLGPERKEAVDYPDFALAVARQVAEGKADRGVMIDSIGVASAMVANRIRGVRAAPCWNPDVAKSARSHNDANIITLGGKVFSLEQAWEILKIFLDEPFSGGRHERRVRKIEAVSR